MNKAKKLTEIREAASEKDVLTKTSLQPEPTSTTSDFAKAPIIYSIKTNPWKTLKKSDLRKADRADKIYHHPIIDIILETPLELRKKTASIKQHTEEHTETHHANFMNLLFDFIEKHADPRNIARIRTCDFSDIKLVNSNNEVVFENFGHLIVTAWRYDQYASNVCAAKEDTRPKSLYYNTPLQYLHACITSDTWEHAREADIDKAFDKYKKKDKYTHINIQEPGNQITYSDHPARNRTIALIVSACIQLYGGVPMKLPEEFKSLIFYSHGTITGASLLKKLRLGFQDAPREEIAFLKNPARILYHWITNIDYQQRENLKKKSQEVNIEFPFQNLEIREIDINADPSIALTTRKLRQAQPGEDTITCSAIGRLRKNKLLSADGFLSLIRGFSNEAQAEAPWTGASYTSGAFYDRLNDFQEIIAEVVRKKLIDTSKPEYFTNSLPNLKFVNYQNAVVFESLGHLVAEAARYQNYLNQQELIVAHNLKTEMRLAAYERVTPFAMLGKMMRSCGGDAEMHDMHLKKRKGVFNGVSAQLTALEAYDDQINDKAEGDIQDRIDKSDKIALLALQEACYQLFGAIPSNLKLALEKEQFNAVDTRIIPSFSEHDLIKRAIRYCRKNNLARTPKALVSLLANRTIGAKLAKISEPTTKSKVNPTIPPQEQRIMNLAIRNDLSPEVLFFALCSLDLEKETPRALKDFGERIIVAHGTTQSHELSSKYSSPINNICLLVEESLETRRTIKYDDLFKRRFFDLLKQLCHRAADTDLNKVITELKNYKAHIAKTKNEAAAKILDKVLSDVCPELVKLFELVKDFKDPATLKVTLLPEQREGIIGALYFQRPLFIYGTGTGKTEICAGYCEAKAAERILWGTRTGNVAETAKRLREKILAPGITVGELTSDLGHKPIDDFKRFLSKHKYIVAGYDTLRSLNENHKEHFAVLQEWIKNHTRVLDEGQFLDNYRSGRSRAIQALSSKDTVVASATPFQHKPARVSTILNLALPQKFPDPFACSLELQKNPKIIRDTLLAHSTMYSIQDLAKHIEDPEKISFQDQFKAGRPLIPKLVYKVTPFTLSEQHGRHYVDIATNFPAYAVENDIEANPLSQLTALSRLAYHPEKLGAPPPLALIDAIKQIAIPAMERGEKVLVFGQRLHALEFLSQDPEMAQYGNALLNGNMPAKERAEKLEEFEENPKIHWVAAQVDTIGTGSNCRAVNHIIFIDLPKLDSGVKQALGRAVRLLFPGEERFAKTTVTAHFLEAHIPQSVIAEVSNTRRRQVLEKGSYYEGITKRRLSSVQAYDYYISRGRAKSSTAAASLSAEQIVEKLVEAGEKLSTFVARHEDLLSAEHRLINIYNNPIKQSWRVDEHLEFLRGNISSLNKPIEEVKVVHLAGPQCLQVPNLLGLGLKPENIYIFESDKGLKGKICHDNAMRFGCRFFGHKVEHALPYFKQKIDVVDIDPDGYVTPELFHMFLKLPIAERAIVMKNSLVAREQHGAAQLLANTFGKREFLDIALIKLVSTYDMHPYSNGHAEHALKVARFTQLASKRIATVLTQSIGGEFATYADLIGEAFLGSMHVSKFHQVRYINPGGTPFLSTFILANAWNREIRDNKTIVSLRELTAKMIHEIITESRWPKKEDIIVETTDDSIFLKHRNKGLYKISNSQFQHALNYFKAAVPKETRLGSLIHYEPVTLRVSEMY